MTTLNNITFKGFRAIVLGYACSNEGLVYLRMAGEHNAVKAIWACLVGAEKSQAEKWAAIQVGPYRGITPIKGLEYRTLQAALPHGYLDLAMLHPAMTATDIADDEAAPLYFALSKGETGPPPAFFERLNSRLRLPLLPEWAGWLWRDGLTGIPKCRAAAIHSLDTLGIDQVYLVYTNGAKELWKAIIKRNAWLLRLPADEAALTALRYCGETVDVGECADVNLALAAQLYSRVREVAATASGEGRAAWVILRERLYLFLKQAADEGLVNVTDWDIKQEVEKTPVAGILPYDDQHQISHNLIYAVRKLKHHYKPGQGDGRLPPQAVEALTQAEAALVGLTGQLNGFVTDAEKAMAAHYLPVAQQLRQAMNNRVYPDDIGVIAPYQGNYYIEKTREVRTPRDFSFWL